MNPDAGWAGQQTTRNFRTARNAPSTRLVPACILGLALGLAVKGGVPSATAQPGTDPCEALFTGTEPVPHLHLEVSAVDLQRLGDSTSVRDGAFRPEVAATVREGTNVYSRVAVHLKGARGSFRPIDDKPAFTLQFNEHVKPQRFRGLEKISLNNSVQDGTYLCEYLGRRMLAAAGVPVPRAAHAVVSLNGRRLGLYVLLEGWNKQWLRRHFPDASGNFYEPDFHEDLPGPFAVKSGLDKARTDHRALAAATAAMERPATERWAALEPVLDRDRFISGLALEVLLQHWDGYCGNQNNYRIYHDPATGRIVFLPHGLDQLFGLRRWRNDSTLLPQMRGRMAVAVLETPEGLAAYLDRFGWALTNVYDVARWTTETQRMAARLRPELTQDPSDRTLFDDQVERLLQRLAARHDEAIDLWRATMKLPAFTGRDPIVIKNWRYRRPNSANGFGGGVGFGFRPRDNAPGYLRLQPERSGEMGSWRAIILLDPGRYRFEALARQAAGTTDGRGIAIGSSFGPDTKRKPSAPGQTQLSHEFVVHARRHVELRCEADTESAWVEFEPESMRLRRLEAP